MDLTPDCISGYRLIKQLGQGGMATVYLGTQENLRRDVALKVMAPQFAQDEGFAERFLAEARLTARLNHPNIMIVHDVGRSGAHYYIATELLPGGTLKERLPQLTTLVDKLRVVRGIARGLAYAHEHRVVHRDVKPVNIMFRDDVQPVITDFGIAKALDATRAMTLDGTVMGTPHYMSPEQAQGLPLDGRSDLYSLGIMLYEMLVGQVPYQAPDPLAVLMMHLQQPVPRLPETFQQLQPVLDRLLAKDRADRYKAAEALLADLEPHLGRTATGRVSLVSQHRTMPMPTAAGEVAKEPLAAHQAPASAVDSDQAQAAAERPPPPKSTNRSSDAVTFSDGGPALPAVGSSRKLVGAGVALLALLAAATAWMFRGSDEPVAGSEVTEAVATIRSSAEPKSGAVTPLLTVTRQQLSAGRFMSPAGDNAYESLQRLLKSFPTDPDVLALTRELSGAIAASVRQDWAEGRRTEALGSLRLALEHLPNDVVLADLRAELQVQIESQPANAQPQAPSEDVRSLLQRAEQLRAAAQLTSPPGDNAVEALHAVLRLEPGHAAALSMLAEIANDYLRVAQTFRDRKRADQALLQTRNGLKAEPTHARLLRLESELQRELSQPGAPP